MELDEYQTLKLIQERISNKVYSFRNWQDFVTWVKGMTQAKFKAFILQCLDDVNFRWRCEEGRPARSQGFN